VAVDRRPANAGLEQLSALVGGHAGTVVTDADTDAGVAAVDLERDDRARVAGGVVE
jgi:hypothetical protein